MQTHLARSILASSRRLALPIGVYGGLTITGRTVREAVTDGDVQAEAVLAMHDRFRSDFLLTAMDLSAEAEAFGCEIRLSDEEVPTVIGRRVTSPAEIAALPDPAPGDARTAVHLTAARRLVAAQTGTPVPDRTPDLDRTPVLAGMIGPFSLAGRIFGVSEALEASLVEPTTLHALLEKVTAFLIRYALAFREVGAQGVVMAEPAAGLLSPRGMGKVATPYVRQIVEAVQTEDFAVVLHNCGARLVHLARVLETGAEICHFSTPMDLPAALDRVADQGLADAVILSGNLDPTATFYQGTPDTVAAQTRALLAATAQHRNFLPGSGCDLPPGTPPENLDAFYATVRAWEG